MCKAHIHTHTTQINSIMKSNIVTWTSFVLSNTCCFSCFNGLVLPYFLVCSWPADNRDGDADCFSTSVGYDIHFYFKDFDNTDITIVQVNDLGGTISLTPFSNAFSGNIAQGGTLNVLLPGMVQGPIFLPVTCNFTGLLGDDLPPCDSAPKEPRFEVILVRQKKDSDRRGEKGIID